ncbi:MAG: ammonium transporter [bacterium]|jgi:Amt family ammonium transporter|nr:ammonium transporter [bacterium]
MNSTRSGRKFKRTLAALGTCLLAMPAMAQEAPAEISNGDTAWILMSTAMVILMTAPGLALFYGGLVNQRNVLSTLMHSFFAMCLISVQWVLWGYSFSFGSGIGGIFGGFDFLLFNGVGQEAHGSVPHLAFAAFQGAFAVITLALITGAVVERFTFKAYILFALLWTTLIYDPLCYWVWGGGWIGQLGALDFAGGTVVHISSGASALVACLVIGRRSAYPSRILPPHSVPLTVIGTSLLWFGWFGFNAGSALEAGGLAALAFVVTHTAAAMAGMTWAFMEWIFDGRPTVLGAATGVVAGLVAITPAAGFVTVPSSIVIGLVAGVLCYYGVYKLKPMLGYDDSLDVVGVHGLGGTWGAIATGIFATTSVNAAGADGLLYGNPAQLVPQIISIAAAWGLAGIGTLIILKVVGVIVPLRVKPEEESVGCDLTLHGETAYNYLAPGMSTSDQG